MTTDDTAVVAIPINQRVPDHTLRDIRLTMHMSQAKFACAVQHTGQVLGEPNTCDSDKRLIQRWESGEHTDWRTNYRRAPRMVTQKTHAQLGFTGSGPPAALDEMPQRIPQLPIPEAAAHNVAGDSAADRLRHALPAPAHADAEMVAVTEISLTQLFTAERGMAARMVVGSAYEQLDDLSVLLAGISRGPLWRRLLAVAGAHVAVAGQLACEVCSSPAR